jgi:hypothetical protein
MKNLTMKANQFRQNRQIPICGGVHPRGGYVAWPDKQTQSDQDKKMDLIRRRREKRGFVAWPEETGLINN